MGAPSRVDQATIAFRRVLAEANSGEQARVDALVVLAQRTVYVATWPGQPQSARTLTNSHGESALPLFTGIDVLDTTATRFGWRHPDGSLPFRELGAREALRHALARSVHFVVIDIGCEHSVEFAREELEPLVPISTRPGVSGPFAGTGERQAALLDAVRRTSNRPPRSPLPAQPPTGNALSLRDSQPNAIPAIRNPSPPAPASAVQAHVTPPISPTRPMLDVGPTQPSAPLQAKQAPAAQPLLDAGPTQPSVPLQAKAKSSSTLTAPAALGQAGDGAQHAHHASTQHAASGHYQYAGTQPAAMQHAPTQYAGTQAARPAAPQPSAAAAVTVPPPPPLAARLRTPTPDVKHPSQHGTPRAPTPPEQKPVSGPRPVMQDAAPPLPANNQAAPRNDEPTLAERTGNHPNVLAARVPDNVLQGISVGLRGFPEVEWACVMSDGSDIPLIGVRVDPSFLNRVADITDAIMDVGDKQELALQVLLLNNQELIKNARKNGRAFYPWKR